MPTTATRSSTFPTGAALAGVHSLWPDYQSLCEQYYSGELTETDWAAWYAERLPAVLRHVTTRSPFYRRHLSDVDIEGATPADLSAVPFTTKADLRREMHRVLSGTLADAAVYYETTGTTGPSTPCPRAALDILASDVHVEESWRRLFAHHFADRMPVIGLMGPSELYAFGDTFGDVARRLGACYVKIWPESPRVGFARALRLMHELGVEVVVCAPALCLSLAKAARYHGYDIGQDFRVKLFLVLGEICTPAFAANVKSVWQADTVPTLYGSQEAMAIATGCRNGRLHLSRPNYLVEVVDPSTGAVRGARGEGELCLTMLVPGIKPLIRYRTGDLVSVDGRSCDCGLPGQVVDVLGRVADRVAIGGQDFRAADWEAAILEGVRGCLGYQVVIDTGPPGSDRLTVRLDLWPEISGDLDGVRRRVADRLGERCRVDAEVSVTDELDPITGTGSFVSWKAARILDNRVPADRDIAAARDAARRQNITS